MTTVKYAFLLEVLITVFFIIISSLGDFYLMEDYSLLDYLITCKFKWRKPVTNYLPL